MIDEKNTEKIKKAIEDITAILDDWNILELDDQAWVKFYDARKALMILDRNEVEAS